MSEYQYYEFVTANRQLTSDEMNQLRSISTRADISSTRFCNTYNFGNLKAQPERMLADYFDAFVYVSNFAYRRFMLKLPSGSFTASTLKPYFPGDSCCFKEQDDFWFLEFCYSDENGYDEEWIEGEGWMGSLLSIRSELMRGDYRSLYIAWLAEVENLDRNNEIPVNLAEPPVPDRLGELTASQSALCEFLKLPKYILEAAASGSCSLRPDDAGKKVDQWLSALIPSDAQALIKDLLLDELGAKRNEVLSSILHKVANQGKKEKRTVSELKEDARVLRKQAVEKAAKEREKQLAEKAEQIAAQEDQYWSRVQELFEKRGSGSVYSELSAKMKDLRLVAERNNRLEGFEKRCAELRHRFKNKQGHWSGLSRAGL